MNVGRHKHDIEGNPRVIVRNFFLKQALIVNRYRAAWRKVMSLLFFSVADHQVMPTATAGIEHLSTSIYKRQWERSNRVLPFSFAFPTFSFQDPN
jgi:hypothetical protein